MYEVLHQYLPKIKQSDILGRLGLEKVKYFVVSSHREENIASEKDFLHLVIILNKVAETYDFQTKEWRMFMFYVPFAEILLAR